jgi:golgin subfamily B member 1
VNQDLLARLSEEQPDPAAISAFAQRLVADPAPHVSLDETLADLPDATVRVLSAALAEQLALEAAALEDRDAAELLHHAASLYGVTGSEGAGQARCLAEAYTRFPSLNTLDVVNTLLGADDADCQLAARAQLDSSELGLKALKTIVERWLEAGRFEHVVELLGSAAEVHGEARELLRALVGEVEPPEEITLGDEAEAAPEPAPDDMVAMEPPDAVVEAASQEETPEPQPGASLEVAAEAEELPQPHTEAQAATEIQQGAFSFDSGDEEEAVEATAEAPLEAPEDAAALAAILRTEHIRQIMMERIGLRRLRAKGDREAALDALSGPSNPPENAVGFIAAAAREGDDGDYEAAASVLAAAIREAEGDDAKFALMAELGRIYEVRLDDALRAERVYRKMRVIDPRAIRALAFYRDWERLSENAKQAYELLRLLHEELKHANLVEERTAIALELVDLAETRLKGQDPKVEAWRCLLEDAPAHVRARRSLISLYTGLGRWDELATHLNEWIDALPHDANDQRVRLLFELINVYQDPDQSPNDALVIATYQRILTIAPNDVRALDQLAARYEDRERWSDLAYVLSQKIAVSDDPVELAELFGQVAHLYLERIQSDKDAIPVLERILDIDAGNMDVIRQLRQIYERQHDSRHLYETFQRELAQLEGADRIDVLIELARLAQDALELPDQAASWWNKVLALEPDHRLATKELEMLRVAQEDWSDYAKLLRQRVESAKTRKQRVEALLDLGEMTYTRLEDEEAATEIFTQVCELSPFNNQARSFLQQIYVKQREWAQLEGLYAPRADWDGYLSLLSDTIRGNRDLALIADIQVEMARVAAEQLEEPQQARKYLSQALDGSPQRVDVAVLLLEQHSERLTDDARLSAHEVIAQHADDAMARETAWLAVAELRTAQEDTHGTFTAFGQALLHAAQRGVLEGLDAVLDAATVIHAWEDARELLDEALLKLPEGDASETAQLELHRALGHLHKGRLSDPDSAVAQFRNVLQLVPGDEDALSALETIHLSRNDLEALEEVLRARADHFQDAEIVRISLQELGKLYEEVLFDSEGAANTYRELLDLDPNDDTPLEDLERVLLVAGAHARLAEALEDLLPLMEPVEPNRRWRFRLASLYRHELSDPHATVDHLRVLIDEDGPQREEAIALLEAMFETGEAMSPVATLLATVYEGRGDDERLATTLEACLEAAETRDEKLAIVDALLPLQEDRLGRPGEAFKSLSVRFRLEPDEREAWPKLLQLANASGKEGELAELWRVAISSDSAQGHPGTTASLNHLRIALARFVRLQFGEFEEPLDLLEDVLRDADSPGDYPELLEELEALHSARQDPEALVRVLLASSRAVLDSTERREKVLEACGLLRAELARPEDALGHYHVLYADDPNEPSVAEAIEDTYTHLEQWTELADWLSQHVDKLIAPERAAEAHVRLLVLRHDRLDDQEAAYGDLRELAQREFTASRARGVLVDFARRPETTEEQRNTLLDWVEAMAREDDDSWALAHVFEARTVGFKAGADRAQYLVAAAKLLIPRLPLPEGFSDHRIGMKAFELSAMSIREEPSCEDASEWLDALVAPMDLWTPYVEVYEDAATRAEGARAAALLARAARASEHELDDLDRALDNWRAGLAGLADETTPAAVTALSELERLFAAHDLLDARLDLLTERADRATDLGHSLRLLQTRTVLLEGLDRVDEAAAGLHQIVSLSGGQVAEDVATVRDEAMTRLETLLTDQGRSETMVDLLVESADNAADVGVSTRWLTAAADIAETRLEQAGQAATIYERLLDLVPDNETANSALERIYRASNGWDSLANLFDRQQGVQIGAGDEPAAVETLFKLGQLARNRLGDEARAVRAYSECVALDPSFANAIEALCAASKRDQYGVAARESLSGAYRLTERWVLLAELLKDRIAREDAGVVEADLYAELGHLCLDRLDDMDGAWQPALTSFEAATLDAQIVARRPLLTRAGLAAGTQGALIAAVLKGGMRIGEAECRGQMLADAGQDLIEGGIESEALEGLWRATVAADITQSVALGRLEALLRKAEERSDELADVLALRESQSPPEEQGAIRRERGLLLSKLEGREADALGCLTEFEGDAQLDSLLARLYEACEQWTALTNLLSAQQTRCTDEETPLLKRRSAEVQWRQLDMTSEAISLFAEVLEAIPGDQATIAHLEAMWSAETEREPVFHMLTAHYEAQELWSRQIALYRAAVVDETLAHYRTSSLETIARIQLEQLQDPDGAFDTTKTLVRDAADPFERSEELEGLAEVAGRWEDVAQFYEGLVMDGQGSLEFVNRLAAICREQLNDTPRAIRVFELASSRDANDDRYDVHLAALAAEDGAWETLLTHYRSIASVATKTERIIASHRAAAQLLLTELSRPLEAARELEAAFTLAPEDGQISEELAQALDAAGERDSLVAHYRTWLARADDEQRPALRCRLASVMLSQVVDANEAIRLLATELEGSAREEALRQLTYFLRDSNGSGEGWRRPIEAAATLYEQTLGDALTKAQMAVAEAARLRVLPEGPEQQARRLKLAEILESEGDTEASFALYAHALRRAKNDSTIEAALERLAEVLENWTGLAGLYTEIVDTMTHGDSQHRLLGKLARIYQEQVVDATQSAHWYERLLVARPSDLEALTALAGHYREQQAATDEARILTCWRASDASEGHRGTLTRRLAVLTMDELNDAAQALSLLEELLPEVAHDEDYSVRLVQLYEHSQRWDRLMDLCDAALESEDLAPEIAVTWWLRKAELAERQLGNLHTAGVATRAALDLSPEHHDAWQQLARIERGREDWAALDDVLARQLALAESSEAQLGLHLLRADLSLNEQEKPLDALVHIGQTDTLVREAPPTSLITLLEALTNHDETRLEASQRLQGPYRQLKRWEPLYKALMGQLRLEGRADNIALTMEAMAVAKDHLRDPRLALKTALPTFRLTPSDLSLRSAIVALAEETGYWDELFDEGEAALDTIADASIRGAHARWLGDTMVAQGRPETAVWAYESVLEALPSDRGAMEALEQLHADADRYDAQLKTLERQLSSLSLADGERARVHMRMATIQEAHLKDIEAARESATSALEFNAGSHQALEMIARAARSGGDWSALDTSLSQRAELLSNRLEAIPLLLERATIAREQLEDIEGALTLVIEADECLPEGSGRTEVNAALKSFCGVAEVESRAAVQLEARMRAAEDWNATAAMLQIQLAHCVEAEAAEALTQRWVATVDLIEGSQKRALSALLSAAARFPQRHALWLDAAVRAEAAGLWTMAFDAAQSALDGMSTSPAKVALGMWLAAHVEEQGGDTLRVQHALEHVLRAAPQREDAFARLEAMHTANENNAGLLALLDLALAADDLKRERRLELLTRKRDIASAIPGYLSTLRDACAGILELAPQDHEALRTLERLARDDDDWEALDLVLQRRLDIAGDKSAKISLGLQRAENAIDRLSRPEAALSHAMTADALVGPGPGNEGLIDLFEGLLDHASTREAAAARLETRYRVREDWARLFNVLAVLRTTLTAGEQVEALTVEMVRLAHHELSDPSAALRTALDSLKDFPERLGLRTWIVDLAKETEGWDTVFTTVESVLDTHDDPSLVQALSLWLGSLYVDQGGHSQEAIKTFERVHTIDADNIPAMDALEALYAATEELTALRELLSTRLKQAKDNERAEILQKLAEWTERAEGPVAALAWWKELLWERPEHGPARAAVGALLEVEETADTAAGLLEPIFQREENWVGLIKVLAARAEREPDPSQSVSLWMRLASLRETELNDATGAFSSYAKALKASPERRDVLRGLERMAEHAELWGALSEELERLVEIIENPSRRAELLIRLGEIYETQLSRPNRAIDSLRAALLIDEESRPILKGLRRLYDKAQQTEPLLEMTRRLAHLARRPLEARELWACVQALCDTLGDHPGTLEATRKLLEYNPEDEPAMARLMALLEAVGEYDELSELLEQQASASNSAEKTASSLVQLAVIREAQQGDAKGALAAYLQALSHVPTHEQAFEAVRVRYEEAERWADLLAVSRRRAEALVSPGGAASAWIAVARLASTQMDEPKEATRALEKALALDKRNQDVLRELGRMAQNEGRIEDYLGYLTQLAEVLEDPEARRAEQVNAAVIYMEQLGEIGEAEGLLEAILREVPDHEAAVDALAQLRASQTRYAEAAGLLERVVAGRTGRAKMDALCRLAGLYDDYLGRTNEARGLLTQALALDEAEAYTVQLAELLEQTRSWPELVALRERQYDQAQGLGDQSDMALVLANLYLHELDDDEGFEDWIAKAQGARRDNPKVVEALIDFYAGREQWDRVAPRLEWLVRYLEAKRLTKELTVRAHQLANLMERLEQPQEALDYYKLSMQTDGTYLPNIVDYGRFLVRQGRWERALRVHQNLLIQSRKLSDDIQAQVLYHLTLSCHELDQRDKTQQYLNRLLSQAPEHSEGLALKARMKSEAS